MSRKARLFYVGPVGASTISRRLGQDRYVGAADNKVMSLAQAMREAGVAAVVVSNVYDRPPGARLSGAIKSGKVAYVRTWAAGSAGIRRIATALSLLMFSMRLVKKRDRVLLYNFFPEYLLMAAYLRLIGQAAMLDVEDGPTENARGLREMVVRLSYRLIRPMTTKRCVAASHSLAKNLGLTDVLAVYGVARTPQAALPARRFQNPRVQILFGGAILPGTGWHLFRDTLRSLTDQGTGRDLDFHVTGNFDTTQMEDLRASLNTNGPTLTIHPRLDATAYRSLLEQCDIGLALKIPEDEISVTTFPSKVVEIASAGLLLISTPASDVPLLFSDENAVIMKNCSPLEFCEILKNILDDRQKYAERALSGYYHTLEQFSPNRVAQELAEFVLRP